MARCFFSRVAVRPWIGLGILFASTLGGPADAQLGHVVKAQKISATAGGFDAELEEMDQFGRSIVNLGDLDGDGVTDLLVGAHTDDDGALDKGSVYVLFLKANGSVDHWQKISDLAGNFAGQLRRGDQFGRAAANLGDLDLDGVIDVAVSANYDDDGGANKGAVYILFLNVDGTVKASQKISSLQGGLPVTLNMHDEFGRSLTALGDLDGDGVTELLVGTPEDDEGGTNTGALHVLFLNRDGTVKDYRRISKFSSGLAIKPGDWFGFCSANLGDLDGDGVVDVAVGAVLDDDGGVNQGSLWILFLRADGSVKSAREIDELEGGLPALDDIDQFGTSVANLGDLDDDGVIDVAVGAVKDDDGGQPGDPDADVGAVYVLFLNPDASVKSCVKLSDTSGSVPFALDQWDWFGSALAPTGGSSGDGLFNVVIGCRNDDDAGGNYGAIYLTQLNDGTAPAAQFEVSATLGVAPMTVSFTDTSAGIVSAWNWNFGDGGAQSNQQSPTKTYTVPGTYDVQLVARGPKGVDSEIKRGLVTVTNGLLASFGAAPRTGPCPLSVAFADQSEGAVTSWSWDFGDGQVSSLRNPVHLYAACGSYTVTLTITGSNGTHTRVEPAFVVAALVPPHADFGATPASGPAPLDVQFGDSSSGQVTSWSWDFGDGQFSDLASPLHRYEAEGLYTVTLTATGPGGSDVETKSACVRVTGPPPSAYFEANPTIGPEPLTVAFTDVTTGVVTSWAWDFGDGGTSSVREPVHTYARSGLYTVTLTVDGPNGVDVRTLTDLITVEPGVPVASFDATPASGAVPLAVQFTDHSSLTVTSWAWSFGDGASSSERHPSHLYRGPGTYDVSLRVSSPTGSDVRTRVGLIHALPPPPTAEFWAGPTLGLAPLTVQFNDASSGAVTSWEWSFGDGATSSAASPTHVYTSPGIFAVTLTARGPGGADGETKPGLVTVLPEAPVAAFGAAPTSGNAPLTVQFTNASSGLVTSWAWDFGDGGTSSAASPAHVYTTPGTFNVTLIASGLGGSDGETKPGLITALPPVPVADFAAAPTTGTAPLTVQFTNATSGLATSWVWDFGDGATSSSASPTHVYAAPGTFTVSLTATGPGGSDGESKPGLVTVVPPAPAAAFGAAPTSGVAPLTVQFTDASTGAVTSWAWDFGDGTTASAASPGHVYATPGTFSVSLRATGPGGSDDEIHVDLVHVSPAPPVAEFTFTPREGFAPLQVGFTDQSAGMITSWSWSFDDGESSTLQHPLHVFAAADSYAVTLTVTGPAGQSQRRRTLLVHEPPVFADGSFELQTPGLAPGGAWEVYNGNSVLVRPTGLAADHGFPSAGGNWCDIGADGSSSARAPSNPLGAGTGAGGACGLHQDFLFPSGTPHLFFEAAFLLNGSQDSSSRNDFMSVDLSDGLTVWNVFFADSFSEFPLVSSQHGFAMTERRTVHVDLRALFPGASETTVLSLRASVGNVGGGVAPSRGYLDALRFAPAATAAFRNGHGRNPVFYSCSPAVIGGSWTLDVDSSILPDARLVFVHARTTPLAGIPAPGGELLIAGTWLFKLSLPVSGGLDHFEMGVPNEPALIGFAASTQATLFSRTLQRGNAYDLRLGY